jgi:hypothetical protein
MTPAQPLHLLIPASAPARYSVSITLGAEATSPILRESPTRGDQ